MEDNKGYIEDIRVTVKPTKPLKQFIQSSNKLNHLKNKKRDSSLGLEDLKDVANVLHQEGTEGLLTGDKLDQALEKIIREGEKFTHKSKGPYLHELLEGAEVILPANSVVERNPELAARVEKLRREQNEREYQQMTKGVSPGRFQKEDTLAFQMQMMNRQLIGVGQVVLSVAAGFAFGFFGMPLMIGGLEFGIRILIGLLCAVVIAIAELYFLGKHLYTDDSIMDGTLQQQPPAKSHQD